jgi:hypothetical protein
LRSEYIGLPGEAVRFRAGQGRARGRQDARVDASDGHAGVRGAGVHHDGSPDGEERRVRLRRGAAGAAVGAQVGGQESAAAGAEPGGVGPALPDRRPPPEPRHGPQPRRPVLQPGGAQGRRGGPPVRQPQPQVAPPRVRRRRGARAAARARRRPRRPARVRRAAGRRRPCRQQGRRKLRWQTRSPEVRGRGGGDTVGVTRRLATDRSIKQSLLW